MDYMNAGGRERSLTWQEAVLSARFDSPGIREIPNLRLLAGWLISEYGAEPDAILLRSGLKMLQRIDDLLICVGRWLWKQLVFAYPR